jgi:polyisoprenoid-binding protein YceI
MSRHAVCVGILACLVVAETAAAQQPFGTQRHAQIQEEPDPCAQASREDGEGRSLDGRIDDRLKDQDSVIYRLAPDSCFQVKTGKAGLLSFAGHSHLIQARAFRGRVVYYPKAPGRSHLEMTVVADSLEVLTPPDTAEIRKVTAAMRQDVLRTAEHHEITLVSRQVTPGGKGFHVTAALTLVGQTREVPIDVAVHLGADTLRAGSTFSVKQTDFGIKPFSGGPGGTVKVADRVMFDIHAIAVRTAGD